VILQYDENDVAGVRRTGWSEGRETCGILPVDSRNSSLCHGGRSQKDEAYEKSLKGQSQAILVAIRPRSQYSQGRSFLTEEPERLRWETGNWFAVTPFDKRRENYCYSQTNRDANQKQCRGVALDQALQANSIRRWRLSG
jgi:hypothetical protein